MDVHLWRSVNVLGLLLTAHLFASSAMSAGVSGNRGGGGSASTQRITILYDAFGRMTAMKKDWGAALGNNPEVFAQNVKAANDQHDALSCVYCQ